MPTSSSSGAPRPNIRQIAVAAKVSPMTVSRVLHNTRYVAPVLRARVLKAVEKLGYKPDPMLTKLMRHIRQRKNVGIEASIAAITTVPANAEPYSLRQVIEAVRERSENLGYRSELFRLEFVDRANPILERSLVSRGIDGIILLQMVFPSIVTPLVDWRKFSVVAATSSIISPQFPTVNRDYYHNARIICAELSNRGFRRIGFVSPGTFNTRTDDAFISALSRAAMAAEENPIPPLIFSGRIISKLKFEDWLLRENPDAIVTHDDEMVSLFRDHLGIGTKINLPIFCTNLNPERSICSGINERPELIGRTAVDMLTGMIQRNEKNLQMTHSKIVIEGEWFESTMRADAVAS